ncbi:MAG: class I SAM-dependent methyltransferase [Pedobacter sp.]|nr:MAG: class I SAM-dependent methyltransferase [Pedobacter sp.]
MSFTEEQLKALAQQLGKPNGEHGINVANMMHDSNLGMTKSTYKALNLSNDDQILEFGHGNGKHIGEILSSAENITYTGLEISELMKSEAESQKLEKCFFELYDGTKIPFQEDSFSKAFTVNTIYFWEKPLELLKDIYRVLKTDGLFCIGFAHKEFMQTLPFTQHGFNLYNDEMLQELVEKTEFKLIGITHHTEKVRSKADEMVERVYSVATLRK